MELSNENTKGVLSVQLPERVCRLCGEGSYWLRSGFYAEWVCNRCHPLNDGITTGIVQVSLVSKDVDSIKRGAPVQVDDIRFGPAKITFRARVAGSKFGERPEHYAHAQEFGFHQAKLLEKV